MRRFIALLGVLLFVLGIRLYNNGLLNCGYSGVVSVGTFDTVPLDEAPLLISGPHRIDIEGGDEETAAQIIGNLCGKELFREVIDDIVVIYAYCERLCGYKRVNEQKVNLMLAVTNVGLSAGTPLLYGSY